MLHDCGELFFETYILLHPEGDPFETRAYGSLLSVKNRVTKGKEEYVSWEEAQRIADTDLSEVPKDPRNFHGSRNFSFGRDQFLRPVDQQLFRDL